MLRICNMLSCRGAYGRRHSLAGLRTFEMSVVIQFESAREIARVPKGMS